MEIITNAENRKELVKALDGHFGQRSEYLGPPSFAYRIGSITVAGTQRSSLKMTVWKMR